MGQLPHNIYEQQAANKRKTILVMAFFVLFFGFLGLGFDVLILDVGRSGMWTGGGIPIGTIVALGVGGMSAVWSLESGAANVLASSCATPVPLDDPKYQQLRNVVDEMTIASGLPHPQLYLIPDPDPNAFATGKDPDHACIAVTEGLVKQLNRDELQGVIAHEMGHVRNYDIRVMTVVAALIGAVLLLSEFGLRTIRFGGGRRKSSSNRGAGGVLLLVLWLVGLVLAPFIAKLLATAVSRQREYLADASGAELTRNPGALASALEKIDAAAEPTRLIKKGTGHLCIADPLGREVNSKEGFFANLFSTHPPIIKRITLLKTMAYQQR
jgi:heat shock protein HtpX